MTAQDRREPWFDTITTGNDGGWNTRRGLLFGTFAISLGLALSPGEAAAASARQIDQRASSALRALYAREPKARTLAEKAQGILIFPRIYKGGLVIGGQSGDGVLRRGGKSVGYYNITAASVGLQAGGQTFSYALFFMNDTALQYLDKSDGWAIGSGPNIVVVDKGAAASISSTTLSQDVYAIPFGQKGLMAGVGLEGSKITRITPTK
jgi:lipid-binding SYLF domain-containing protein